METSEAEYTTQLPDGSSHGDSHTESGAEHHQQGSQERPRVETPSHDHASPETISGWPSHARTTDSDPSATANRLSAAERLKLSMTSLIAGRTDGNSTPVDDHFTPLAGDAHRVRNSVMPSLQAPKYKAESLKHGIMSGETGIETKWGTEGLLGSKPAQRKSSSLVAKAKLSKLSMHLGLTGGGDGDGGGGGESDTSCGYVAMSTPCESPVADAGIPQGGGSYAGHQSGTRSRDSHDFFTSISSSSTTAARGANAPAPSSRAGLVTRLGSALQSWTSGRNASGDNASRFWGGGGDSMVREEGTPGPLGAKYTAQQHQALDNESERDASPQRQLRSTEALEVGAGDVFNTGAGVSEISSPCAAGVSAATGVEQSAEDRGGIPRSANSVEDNSEDRKAGPTLQSPSKASKDPPSEADASCTDHASQRESIEASVDVHASDSLQHQDSLSRRGHDRAQTSSNNTDTLLGQAGQPAGAEAGGGLTVDNMPGGPLWGERQLGGSVGQYRDTMGMVSEKKVGLWELKAELSRLKQALSDAEFDRDVEKSRAERAGDRLKEAVSRLEGLRQMGDGGGVAPLVTVD